MKLRKRALRGDRRLFLVEGAQAIEEAIAAGVLRTLFHSADSEVHPSVVLARQGGVELIPAGDEVIRALTSTVTPQGLVGIAPFVDVPLDDVPERPQLVALLYAVRDPGNAGTVLRSADAAGADAVVLSSDSVDVYNPKTVRSSAGSLFHLPVVNGVDVEEAVSTLQRRGARVIAMAADARHGLFSLDLSGPTVFLFGNEAWGLPSEVAHLADDAVRIPISERAESLNLAAAAAVCLFEARRQRLPGPESGGG